MKTENSVVRQIIRKLKKKEIDIFEIPDELQNNIEIVSFERKYGMRKTRERGFDIISNSFFVNEDIFEDDQADEDSTDSVTLTFRTFDEYFEYLNGDIYEEACYTYCPIPHDYFLSRNIDLKRLFEKKSFTNETIDDYTLELSNDEIQNYKQGKKNHQQCEKWISKFDSCQSCEELTKVITNYRRTKLSSIVPIEFFLSQYALNHSTDKHIFSIIMEYLSQAPFPESEFIYAACLIYDPDEVIKAFNYSIGCQATKYKHKRDLKEYVQHLKNKEIQFSKEAFFDKDTHYYCANLKAFFSNGDKQFTTICNAFETFEEFINFRKGDLRNTDLSAAHELSNVDFSEYIIDETTKLPYSPNTKKSYSVEKYYSSGKFHVKQLWKGLDGSSIKENTYESPYFFDFVAYLKGDLSGANLLFCDGLINLQQWHEINFSCAKLTSVLCEKFELEYKTEEIAFDCITSFSCVSKNENETALTLQKQREVTTELQEASASPYNLASKYKCEKVHYISDLHLMHKIKAAGCRTKEDIYYVVRKIVDNILSCENISLLLIAGDISSDLKIFQLFVDLLNVRRISNSTTVVFTLGNHELWSFPGWNVEKIVEKYRSILSKYDGMYLLHNDLIYAEPSNNQDPSKSSFYFISYSELHSMDKRIVTEKLRSAKYVILGGSGFSGYNTEFNANNGIYQTVLNRETEIGETKKFEDLYNHLYPVICKKNTIVMTHTPKDDWSSSPEYDKNIIYVNGHTHKNFFYDDGEIRVYSDNQIGYHNKVVTPKYLLIDNDYDFFDDYKDGIYEITGEQYKTFYRGRNIPLQIHWNVNPLYMLKKNSYYCFIHKAKNGSLTILNGGGKKKLLHNDISYYYDNMEVMVATIKSPLDKFTKFQKNIALKIQKLGGSGRIHGCIIDIDFYNHVYVNPYNLTVTGYWASDMITKIVYPTIPALLETQCPSLFAKYSNLINDKKNFFPSKKDDPLSLAPQVYSATDIYPASREICKMQKLHTNILCFWNDNLLTVKNTPNKVPEMDLGKTKYFLE